MEADEECAGHGDISSRKWARSEGHTGLGADLGLLDIGLSLVAGFAAVALGHWLGGVL
jgi:hypothetical protein